MTCPPKGNSHEGYSTDETHVKQVRHERPQVVGLLLDKRPEQANPRGSDQPEGYQGWAGGVTTSEIWGNILETRGAGDCTELDTVSCECHRTVLEKQDISQKPKNTNRLHQQAGFKCIARKAKGSLQALQFWVGVSGAGAMCPGPSQAVLHGEDRRRVSRNGATCPPFLGLSSEGGRGAPNSPGL